MLKTSPSYNNLDTCVTPTTAVQSIGLFRKYLFHRDYILEHCSSGLSPVWREILTMMKVVVYLYEHRGTIQVFLIKDINAFLLDNETMPLDRDHFLSSPVLASSSSSSSPVSNSSPEPLYGTPTKGMALGIKASKSFSVISGSLRASFRSRSVSNPVMAPSEFPELDAARFASGSHRAAAHQDHDTQDSETSPTPDKQQQQQFRGAQGNSSSFPSSPSPPPPSSPNLSHLAHHHRAYSSPNTLSGTSLISKIFKSRSFDFKASREPQAAGGEDNVEDAIAQCVLEGGAFPEGKQGEDGLGPLLSQSLKNRTRSSSTSVSRSAASTSILTPSSPASMVPQVRSDSGGSASSPSRMRRCSSGKFSTFDDHSSGLEKSDSDELFSLFSSKAKEQEKDLARERVVRTSYRYHIRRRAICLFHNEDIANEDATNPSRAI